MTRPLALLASTLLLLSAQSPQPPLAGFSPDTARRQFALEKDFDAKLQRQNLQQWLKHLSAKPHHVGSPGSRAVAEFIAAQFKSWGYETEIETFYPLFPTPKTRLLEMTGPDKFTARLGEPPVEGDESSAMTQGGLPVYHAYSIDGDVTAPLVYVNYGLPDDYDKLAQMGIDVKGKIVLARYGASWRGIKPKVAAEHGAIGCLIYSDPRDDGYFMGDVYPKGPWRPRDGAQRGSVMDMPTYPGDPLTPGVGATNKTLRPDFKTAATTLTKIPVMPISYADAEPLLRALAGPVAPPEWRGALPLTYHIGPGPATVHLKLEFNWQLAPTHNVIARMKGSERPDEWILRGNHHDGWVFGASDPLTGMVAVMEEARAISELAKSGWKPKRTLIFCAWDGEEPALLGSTEWAEFHAAELKEHAAVYVNSDGTSRGFVHIGGSHTLETLASQAARDVTDPQTKVTALARAKARQSVLGEPATPELDVTPLGSGSDYTAFVDHLGIASLNIGFGGEGSGAGSYHSNYDTYDHVVKFEDPDFLYTLATVQLGGRLTLRLANADVLPLRVDSFSRTVTNYASEVRKLADDLRTQTAKRNTLIQSGAMQLAADPRRTFILPKPQDPVPFLNFAPLENALARLDAATRAFTALDLSALSPDKAKALDAILMRTERVLTRPEGLPRRPWFQHMIYAPGFYTGYGVKTLPGIREALEQRFWQEAGEQIGYTATALEAFAAEVERAAKMTSN
ncbi:MAG TPA: M20/M25/M40 family metallo-hydrolase [Paludibaculum sp.]|jgi:N-acetylated-alpha-linked acidic dipeptidase